MSVHHVKNKQVIIGLTGGIGSGKTTAARYFESLNIPVIDSDQIVKYLWKNDLDMINEAESFFGFPIKTNEDRKKLSKIIFNDEKKREKLNSIVHPFVFLEIERQKETHKDENIIVIDMPLLIEVDYQKHVDYVVLVYVKKDTQTKRIIERDQISHKEAIRRIESQISLDQKKRYADYILDNENSRLDLYHQIDELLEEIQNEK